LFQDRFKSEKVESDEYLLTAIRYIHQNPVKAGMVKRAEDWEWSSCCSFYSDKSAPEAVLLDSDLILAFFSIDKRQAVVERDEVLRKVKGIGGVTHRQAAIILGISPSLIFKA